MWHKKGLILKPDQCLSWMRSHAQVATPMVLGGNIYRIFFASRDAGQRSHIGYADVDVQTLEIHQKSQRPILSPGGIGTFDEHGVYPSSIIHRDGQIWLYYIGYTRGSQPPLWYASIGLAISSDGGKTFNKFSPAPILSRSQHDPCLVTAPFISHQNGELRMYYVSGCRWEREEGQLYSYYNIKIAFSKDGLSWQQTGQVAIDFKDPLERNLARFCVLGEEGHYHAWYSYATHVTPYRIGYAESKDGIKWKRLDNLAGITTSAEGFDNEMLCYPYVLKHGDSYYLFYNGNQLGSEGIALATSKNLRTDRI